MDRDGVSNKTLTVLVALTVVITIMSTLAVINAVNKLEKNPPAEVSSTNQGDVSLHITDASDTPAEPQHTGATGLVGLEITDTEDNTSTNGSTAGKQMDIPLPNDEV